VLLEVLDFQVESVEEEGKGAASGRFNFGGEELNSDAPF
jgi:hypothetical protein